MVLIYYYFSVGLSMFPLVGEVRWRMRCSKRRGKDARREKRCR